MGTTTTALVKSMKAAYNDILTLAYVVGLGSVVAMIGLAWIIAKGKRSN